MLASSVGLSLHVSNALLNESMYDPENRTSGSSQRHRVEKVDSCDEEENIEVKGGRISQGQEEHYLNGRISVEEREHANREKKEKTVYKPSLCGSPC